MKIGVPKEIKKQEYRVGLVPSSVHELVGHGHALFVETGAGAAINFTDADYKNAGATILPDAKSVFETADMIVKVKEPQPTECKMLREGQILFTYLHLAADLEQTKGLMESGCIAIAYETVTDDEGQLPLLRPMSEIAGRLATQVGTHYMQKHFGGSGMLLSGVPSVAPAKVVVLGGGVSGYNAARMAAGLEARLRIFEKSHSRMRALDNAFQGRAVIEYSSPENIAIAIQDADLIIGAVLVPGAAAPRLISKDQLKIMKPGTVLVDIAIDQGGCFETSKPTTHDDPIYTVDDVVHYCVANMPGAVPRTSALALNAATLEYAIQLANKGWKQALKDNKHLRAGLNVCAGEITYREVAETFDLSYTDTPKALAA